MTSTTQENPAEVSVLTGQVVVTIVRNGMDVTQAGGKMYFLRNLKVDEIGSLLAEKDRSARWDEYVTHRYADWYADYWNYEED